MASRDPEIAEARRFVEAGRAELVRLRAAVAQAKEEVARAQVELDKARAALRHAKGIGKEPA